MNFIIIPALLFSLTSSLYDQLLQKEDNIPRFLSAISFLCRINALTFKNLSTFDRIMDTTNGKEERDDPAEKESA